MSGWDTGALGSTLQPDTGTVLKNRHSPGQRGQKVGIVTDCKGTGQYLRVWSRLTTHLGLGTSAS